jgi:hypothetical protein
VRATNGVVDQSINLMPGTGESCKMEIKESGAVLSSGIALTLLQKISGAIDLGAWGAASAGGNTGCRTKIQRLALRLRT